MVKKFGKIVIEDMTLRDRLLILNPLPSHLHFLSPPLLNLSPKKLLLCGLLGS